MSEEERTTVYSVEQQVMNDGNAPPMKQFFILDRIPSRGAVIGKKLHLSITPQCLN
jgi:hypothetical protein